MYIGYNILKCLQITNFLPWDNQKVICYAVGSQKVGILQKFWSQMIRNTILLASMGRNGIYWKSDSEENFGIYLNIDLSSRLISNTDSTTMRAV